VRYAEQDWSRDGANGPWRSRLHLLVSPPPSTPTPPATDAERADAIADRMQRRAYDGAPPVIPHPITQDTSAACLACHAEGLVVKDRVAPRLSHAPHANCTQCHVPALGLPIQEAGLAKAIAENGFQGWIQQGRGSRAWEGAPPTVPHTTLMRSDCLSCHGTRGHVGLRTPHPERVACVQCHVPEPPRPP
jgi:cytochrome c-type protein NapB